MKYITSLLGIFFFLGNSYAQNIGNISEAEMNQISSEVDRELAFYKTQLDQEIYYSDLEKEMRIEFQSDTFAIERTLFKMLGTDYSTTGMTNAVYYAEAAYDKLLNKYYKLLKSKLNEEDKKRLTDSQRNWILFRDSERILSNEISKEEYSGGGTIQQIIISDKQLEITKQRVIELFGYLDRVILF